MLLHTLHIKTTGIVRMIVLDTGHILIALSEEFVIIEIAVVARDAVVIAHILCLSHLHPCHQSLIKLLTVTRTDDLHL